MQKIERVKVVPPVDGVHVAGEDGFIKGVHSILVDGKLVPYGMVGFYWQIDETTGVKVYYSFAWKKKTPLWKVRQIYRRIRKIWKRTKVNPEPLGLKEIRIKLIKGKGKIKAHAFGIITRHCAYPVEAWTKYAKGYPYDWNCLDQVEHPNHNPSGFLSFKESCLAMARKLGADTRGKLGDISYDMKDKRWYLVDMG
jgi:hypothetical protein